MQPEQVRERIVQRLKADLIGPGGVVELFATVEQHCEGIRTRVHGEG